MTRNKCEKGRFRLFLYVQRRHVGGEGGGGKDFYLQTLIDIVTMAAIFVTSEKNRTSDYPFFFIRVRYSRYDNFTRRRGQETEESPVHPFAEPCNCRYACIFSSSLKSNELPLA